MFLVEDETGRCIVDPDGAEVIRVRGYRPWIRVGGGDYRYTEERLVPGAVYALGWFGTVRNAPGDVNSGVSLLLRDWKADQAVLLSRFDRNGDGP